MSCLAQLVLKSTNSKQLRFKRKNFIRTSSFTHEFLGKTVVVTGARGVLCSYFALELGNLKAAKESAATYLDPVDIVVNEADGDDLRAITDNEYHETDLPEGTKSYFDLEQKESKFVFNLNFLDTVLPIQVLDEDMNDRKGANIVNISSMNGHAPLINIVAYRRAKAANSN